MEVIGNVKNESNLKDVKNMINNFVIYVVYYWKVSVDLVYFFYDLK